MLIKIRFVVFIYLGLFVSHVFSASVITITNADSAGFGFNDTTPFDLPATGNTAATLGQARLNAIQYAVNKLSNRLNSAVNIDVNVKFVSLKGNSTGAILAGAASMRFYQNFQGAPINNTLYHGAIAEKITGINLNRNASGISKYDIRVQINSDVDGNVSLGSRKWYYGFDALPSGGDIDFITVLTHELIHGLGFSTQMTSETGARYLGLHDNFINNLEHHGASPANYSMMTTNLQRSNGNKSAIYSGTRIVGTNLHWVGPALLALANNNNGFEANGHAGMYSPNPVRSGSSVSHFSTLFSRPDEMMEPSYSGPDHNIGLAAQVLEDVGWGKMNSDSRSVDLSVGVASANLNPVRGSNESYFITVTNKSGTNPATGIVVSNFLPRNSTFVSVNPANGATCDTTNVAQNRIVTCSLASLPASGTAIFNVVVRINNATGNVFSANVEALNLDPINQNNNAVNTVLVNNEKPPVFSLIADQTIEEGKTLTLNIIATDPNNGDIPTLSVLNLPNGASFVANGNGQATFIWTPATANVGTNIINFEATDGKSPAVTMSVNITVTALAITEKPPVFSLIADQTIEESKTLTLNIIATDPNNGDIPTLSVLNLPNGASFVANGNGQATFIWTPVTADVGTNFISFEATDGKSPAVSMSVKITVTAKPVPTPNPGTPVPGEETPVAGCTINKLATFDPSFPVLLLILSILYFTRKKKLLL